MRAIRQPKRAPCKCPARLSTSQSCCSWSLQVGHVTRSTRECIRKLISVRGRLPLSGGSRDQTVSASSLRKTGILADTAGDFPRFPPQDRRTESPETKSNMRRAGISGHSALLWEPGRTREWVAGAVGIEPRYGDFESGCSCLPERIYRTPFIRIHKPLETLEFREPYRIHGVQRSGENRAIRRRIGGYAV
jgi:hypothetical protein